MDLGMVTLPRRYLPFPRGLPRDPNGPCQDAPLDFKLRLGGSDDQVQIARADNPHDRPFRQVAVRRRRDGHHVADAVAQRDPAEPATRDAFDDPRVPTDVRADGVARRASAPREIAEVDVDEDGDVGRMPAPVIASWNARSATRSDEPRFASQRVRMSMISSIPVR